MQLLPNDHIYILPFSISILNFFFLSVPPTAITAIVSSLGTARAGMVYNLFCTVTKTVGGLINSPTATWTTGRVAVTNGNGITVSTLVTSETAILTLTFDPLRTSHNGQYSCDGTLTSQALDETLTPSMTMELRVQSQLYVHVLLKV